MGSYCDVPCVLEPFASVLEQDQFGTNEVEFKQSLVELEYVSNIVLLMLTTPHDSRDRVLLHVAKVIMFLPYISFLIPVIATSTHIHLPLTTPLTGMCGPRALSGPRCEKSLAQPFDNRSKIEVTGYVQPSIAKAVEQKTKHSGLTYVSRWL